MTRPARKPPPQTRKERAQGTRQRMVEAAHATFCELGYGRTTMAEVARRAGVAVQTTFFTFHTKAALLTEVVLAAAGGPEARTPVMERPWMKEALSTSDGQRALALIVEHGTEIFRRMAPLWGAMVTAASEDPEFAQRFADIVASRHRGMRAFFGAMAQKSALAPGVTGDHAADSFFLMQNPQVLAMATTTLGWDVETFKAWSFASQLPLMASQRWNPSRTHDLSFHRALKRFVG